ncbi:MAG TPA: formyltetrahydrofolate deformylase [Terriglobales bacterium]|nr:formyltetrahydrofolate deformylase [Terriglobales bacterium]
MRRNSAILLLSCPDKKGVVASIAGFIYQHGGNILHADEHSDVDSGTFLMRVEFDPAEFDIPLNDFARTFAPIAASFGMQWRLAQSDRRPRMAIMVSKYDHCLVDLLYRHQSGEISCEVPCIISNYEESQAIADFYRIPFFLVPVEKQNKVAAELQIRSRLEHNKVDFIVLARYMQILSDGMVQDYPRRIINIHHSFLPAFVGSKPYHQAFTRGVKLIGATSHYVTEVLDDGPIIEQDAVRVSHRDSIDDLIQKGRDLEKVVLSRAVRWHLENRVLVYGNKTVVFE